MSKQDLLKGKRVLIVDDEPDVLATLEDLLSMCDVVKASSFEEAKTVLDTRELDLAVLDIMGVNGFELLALCKRKNITAVMLTAHALTPQNIVQSFKSGAASFIPKDRIADIPVFLTDVLEAKEKGEHFWARWTARLGESYWEKKFGPGWKDTDNKFWREFTNL
jgi:DNA-binding NtrC family response regulator